jgi:hypothetical protein
LRHMRKTKKQPGEMAKADAPIGEQEAERVWDLEIGRSGERDSPPLYHLATIRKFLKRDLKLEVVAFKRQVNFTLFIMYYNIYR